mgnify:CR=1 FL=1
MTMDIGVGLWTMQSTVADSRNHQRLYADMLESARELEQLGFDSMWFAEHRFWYDGWCPSPLTAIAAAVGVTSTLRFGTAMLLLPQHDPDRIASMAQEVAAMSGDRLELGVGLGHRDAEFDALGLRRRDRGRRMEAGLDRLLGGTHPMDPARIWIGGMADAAIERIGRRNASALLPQTLYPDELDAAVARIHRAAGGRSAGRIGVLKDVFVDVDGARARETFLPALESHYREEAGAWWVLDGDANGFTRPELLDKQMQRITRTAIVGSPDEVSAQLSALASVGVDTVVARLNFDVLTPQQYRDSLMLFASAVLPVAVSA